MKKAAITLLIVSLLAGLTGFLSVEVPILEEMEDGYVPYQSLFQTYAPMLGWDWQLLAAVAYHESHFYEKALSSSGACGVMQLLPSTAQEYGLNDSTIWIPKENIRVGAEYIRCLQGKWGFIQNMEEQTKFVLASYNVGPGFVFAARREAREAGVNPYVWSEVEPYVHSAVTRQYVHQILRTSKKYKHDYTER